MLVLSRKLNESIVIDGGIRIMVVSIRGNQVRLGIQAPGSVGIYRSELLDTCEAGDEHAAPHEGELELNLDRLRDVLNAEEAVCAVG